MGRPVKPADDGSGLPMQTDHAFPIKPIVATRAMP
jgi:hypothetical protein